MKAKFINETTNFERGLDSKKALKLGLAGLTPERLIQRIPNTGSFINLIKKTFTSEPPMDPNDSDYFYWQKFLFFLMKFPELGKIYDDLSEILGFRNFKHIDSYYNEMNFEDEWGIDESLIDESKDEFDFASLLIHQFLDYYGEFIKDKGLDMDKIMKKIKIYLDNYPELNIPELNL